MPNQPELDYLPEDDGTDTQRNRPQDTTPLTPRAMPAANVPPPPPPNRRRAAPPPGNQPPHQGRPPRPRQSRARQRQKKRRQGGLYLPLWSLALTVLLVAGCAVGLVVIVVNLGGNTPEDNPPPALIVNSPQPTAQTGPFPASPATPTIPPDLDPGVSGPPPQPPPSFRFSGPTLEAIATATSTPMPVGIGVNVIVTDVEPDELNVRNEPGTRGTEIVFRAPEGTRFTIVEGPRQADGLTWWRVQNTVNTAQTGWAASNYLDVEIGQ